MLKWLLRIERVYKGSQERLKEEIGGQWVSKLHERLRLDRAVTYEWMKELKILYSAHGKGL